MADDRNFVVDHFVSVTNSAVADEAFLNRIEEVRKRRLLVDHACGEQDGLCTDLCAFECCFKRSVRQVLKFGYGA